MGSQALSAGLTKMPDNPEVWKAAAMADQFDKMQKLPDPLPGAPNFHRIPGYKVYTTGQPTLEGVKNILEKVTGTIYPKDGPIIWLFKEFQINASFEGLVETVPGVNLDLLKMDKYTMDPAKDPLNRGEFPVVLALLEKLKGGKEAKNECDKVIDKNGTPKTGGNGIKQLRENIAESKLSYEIMDDAAQVFLKSKIMDNIHKYYYLIVFGGYML